MEQRWLKCRVHKGMFSNELVVECQSPKLGAISKFVPKETVRGAINEEGTVRVEVFRRGDTVWAVLPTEYSESIPVNEHDLVAV